MAKFAHKIPEKCAIFHIIIFSNITTDSMTSFMDRANHYDTTRTVRILPSRRRFHVLGRTDAPYAWFTLQMVSPIPTWLLI